LPDIFSINLGFFSSFSDWFSQEITDNIIQQKLSGARQLDEASRQVRYIA
jgi:hypothetical protein